MQGAVATCSGSPTEPRQRLSASSEDTSKRRSFKDKDYRDVFRPFYGSGQDKSSSCRFRGFKLVIFITLIAIILLLLGSPDRPSSIASRPTFVSQWIGERNIPIVDHRYVSHSAVDWEAIEQIISRLPDTDEYRGIALLNFNDSENERWTKILTNKEHVILKLDHAADNITYTSLYPEFIDETEFYTFTYCPTFPKIHYSGGPRIDLIAVKLPCKKSGENWSRDLARFHLQIETARFAAIAKGDYPVHVMFVTECFPLPNLFNCKDLVVHEGNVWLYKPELNKLREKLQIPVGTCQLAVPLKPKDHSSSGNLRKEAYVTILHSADYYVCGALAAAQSIRMTGSKRELVMLVDKSMKDKHKHVLEAAGWKIHIIEKIANPKADKAAYNKFNYSKFRLWQLTMYDKIVFIDSDLIVLKNIDFLFTLPELSAVENNKLRFNSGVMVIEPSNCTFQLLMDHINDTESYNGGDQGYLNEIFTWWHRIPTYLNVLKNYNYDDEDKLILTKKQLFAADPPVVYVIHFLGFKPWMCFRDYDCNWNVGMMQKFASDIAIKKWWEVHDGMPKKFQKFCMLTSLQKASLEWDRRQAKKANFTDGHWKIKITDPRRDICLGTDCDWEEKLNHWVNPRLPEDSVPHEIREIRFDA